MRLKPSVKLLLIVLLLIGAMVSTWLVVGHQKTRERRLAGVPESRARLIEMLGSSRPFEGRLLGMSYASFDPARPWKPPPRRRLKKALAFISKDKGATEAERLSSMALVYALGNELDLAIQTLARATASKGAKVWMWSDLAALYLARSRDGDLIEALKYSSKSLKHAESQEVLFNHALCLEKLALVWTARKAWLRYVRHDSDSPWSQEVQARLASISAVSRDDYWRDLRRVLSDAMSSGTYLSMEIAINENPQLAREYGEEQLLGEWGRNWLGRNYSKADDALVAARIIGSVLSRRNGDRMLMDTVSIIDREVMGSRIDSLARGHVLYCEGLASLDRLEFAEARKALSSAEGFLASMHSPFAGWAMLRIAICDLQQFGYGRAMVSLVKLYDYGRKAGYMSLEASSLWGIGLVNGIQARPAEATTAYQRAAYLFEKLGEEENLATTKSLTSTSLRSLGNIYESWRQENIALKLLSQVRDKRKQTLILDEAGVLLQRQGLPAVALIFYDEIIYRAKLSRRTDLLVSGLRKKALLCEVLGLHVAAEHAIAEAKKRVLKVNDEAAKTSLMGDLLMIEGQLVSLSDPQAAIRIITPALEIYSRTDYAYELAGLLFQRGCAYKRLGKFRLAEVDLQMAIQAIQEQRHSIPEINLQEQFLLQERKIFEQMVDLQLRLGRPVAALGYAELFRIGSQAPSWLAIALNPEEIVRHIQRDLTDKIVLVDYFATDQSIHVWLIRSKSVECFAVSHKISAIDREAEGLFLAAQIDERAFQNKSRELARFILEPVYSRFNLGEVLVFIPDGSINSVPFAALWDRMLNGYLIESFAVSVSPSAIIYTESLVGSKRLGERFTTILAIGDPDIDRELWPYLSALQGARQEIEEIAGLYSRAKVLLGVNATAAKFMALADDYDVVHFAGHAIINHEQPLLSGMIFSPSALRLKGESGFLYARALYGRRFLHTRLVILAACSTLGERTSGSEGLASLARPFLAGGVPSVLGTLWPVEDSRAREFLVDLHHQIGLTANPLVALQRAQRTAIHLSSSPASSPAVWASFQLIGS